MTVDQTVWDLYAAHALQALVSQFTVTQLDGLSSENEAGDADDRIHQITMIAAMIANDMMVKRRDIRIG